MKPYYEGAGIKIFHGEAADVLSYIDPVDLLLTDPPYGIGASANKDGTIGRSKLGQTQNYGPITWDDAPAPSGLMEAVRGKARYQIIFGGNYYALPPSSCWLVWDKDNGANDFADCELAWTNLPKAVRRLRWRWAGMLQEHGGIHKEPRYHPTQKPLEVMKWALSHAPAEVETVLDPFMGSGTTLRAALELGKRAIGIEREEKYVKIAIQRLSQGVLFVGDGPRTRPEADPSHFPGFSAI